MEAVAIKRGRIRPQVALAKIVASAITIGSGGSAGREGPIVQVGSALGSAFGQLIRLSDEQRSMLVASGAAAGIAATFNAPIAGCLFALEVILARFSNRYLGIVVVAAVAANVVSRSLLGENPAFQVPVYSLNSSLELPLYMVVGVLCALMAILFIRVLYGAEHLVEKIKLPLPLITAAGMALTALVGLIAPEVLGPGLEFIGDSISEDMNMTIGFMLGLLLFKLIATTFTLGTGNSGGVFAPGLFMGALVGGIVGQVGHTIWPETVLTPGAFALVGMAALFAGTARAPITAVVIVLEMSNDYRLILPLLMTVMIATLIADLLHPDTIYTRKLHLRGVQIDSSRDIDLLQMVQVKEVISREYLTVPPDMTVAALYPLFDKTHHHGFPIVARNGSLVGIITLSDVERAHELGDYQERTVVEVGTTNNIITVHPDEFIFQALKRMNVYDIGRLPVVAREDSSRYLGMIRRVDILRAYNVGLTRKSIEMHRESFFKLRDVEEQKLVEIEVKPGTPMVGKTLSEFPHSSHCLAIAIVRGGHTLIPNGQTRILAGDQITAYVDADQQDMIVRYFQNPAPTIEEQQQTGD
jgi:CIC family chloride channel protein